VPKRFARWYGTVEPLIFTDLPAEQLIRNRFFKMRHTLPPPYWKGEGLENELVEKPSLQGNIISQAYRDQVLAKSLAEKSFFYLLSLGG